MRNSVDNKNIKGGDKPPSLSNGLAFAHRRIDILREVVVALVMEKEPAARAELLSQLAIALNTPNG